MKWFKHDSNSNTDAKLRRVRMKYGMQGYGLYWYCLELIASGVEKHNLNFELEHDSEIIAHDTGINYELVQEMMSFMVEQRLFEQLEGRIFCLKMASRTDEYTSKLLRDLDNVPTLSGQSPDKVPPNRREENRTEENRIYISAPTKTKPDRIALDDCLRAYAEKQGMNVATIEAEWEKFEDHEFRATKTDWRRCWQRWCRTWKKKGSEQSDSFIEGFAEFNDDYA